MRKTHPGTEEKSWKRKPFVIPSMEIHLFYFPPVYVLLAGPPAADQIQGKISKQTPECAACCSRKTGTVSFCESTSNTLRSIDYLTRFNPQPPVLKRWNEIHMQQQRLHCPLFSFHLRRCLILFWMRTSWRMRVSTLQSTWRHTGVLHTHHLARHSTRCWDVIWAPPLSPRIRLPSRWNRGKTMMSWDWVVLSCV